MDEDNLTPQQGPDFLRMRKRQENKIKSAFPTASTK
jgi:hypothetical protein